MAQKQIQKPSPQAIGVTTLILGLVGLVAGMWYYREYTASRAQRLRRKANRQLRRAQRKLQR